MEGIRLASALRVMVRNVIVWRRVALASAVGYIGEPLLSLVALGFGLGSVVPEVEGMRYAEFIAPGLVASTVMYTATFECTFGSYTRMETHGTFDAILATPVTVGELVLGEVLFGGLKASIGGTVVLLVATAFGLVPSAWALLLPPFAALAGLLFAAMALAVSSLSRSYDVFNYYFTLVVAPMYLFAGVFFPLARLPAWAGTVAQAMPMTHVVEVARALVRGTPGPASLWHVVAVCAFLVPAHAVAHRGIVRRVAR